MSGKPILVTGAHRSGTTWVGKMLALAPGVATSTSRSARAPRRAQPGAVRPLLHGRHARERGALPARPRADARASATASGAARRVCAAPPTSPVPAATSSAFRAPPATGARPLVKDPIALLSAEWLAERFGMDVVVHDPPPGRLRREPQAARLEAQLRRPSSRTARARGAAALRGRDPRAGRAPGEILDAGGAALAASSTTRSTATASATPDWAFVRHEDASRGAGRDLRAALRAAGPRLHAARARGDRARRARPTTRPSSRRRTRSSSTARASLGRWRDDLTAEEVETLRERTRTSGRASTPTRTGSRSARARRAARSFERRPQLGVGLAPAAERRRGLHLLGGDPLGVAVEPEEAQHLPPRVAAGSAQRSSKRMRR